MRIQWLGVKGFEVCVKYTYVDFGVLDMSGVDKIGAHRGALGLLGGLGRIWL